MDEQEEDCTHMVCSHLMLSSLRVQPECQKINISDPNTGEVEKSCHKCNYYLRDFILYIMKKTEFVPAIEHFFCCRCLVKKNIPPPGYEKVTAVCGDGKQLVTESLADMITFLA